MKVIVNDANILIDLIELDLLANFFELGFEFLTTSLIFEELDDEQQVVLNQYVNSEVLKVKEMTSDQLIEIHKIQLSKRSLSPQDCSAFYQAKIEKGILVSSDNTLRKYAKSKRIDVHGHLWVFDQMYESGTITGQFAINKLDELRNKVNINLGLPNTECENRIKLWAQ